jgi:hypothetical protein
MKIIDYCELILYISAKENVAGRLQMIHEIVTKLAKNTGTKISCVSLIEGRTVGCLDANLLRLTANAQNVGIFVDQSEIDDLRNGTCNGHLEEKILDGLAQLQKLQGRISSKHIISPSNHHN